MTFYQWLLAMLRDIFRKYRPEQLNYVLELMTKYEGHWPEPYTEICKKYNLAVIRPPNRLMRSTPTGIIAIKNLSHPTPAQVAAALEVENEIEVYEQDKLKG
eukprot:2861593-Heterocapsa_arctica.AAC.1